MLSRQPSRRDVILEHMHGTTAYVVAASEPCATIAAKEIAAVRPKRTPQKTGRVMQMLGPHDLTTFVPEGSWGLAILLCPGDNTAAVAAFAKSFGPGWRDRIQFYHHLKTDLNVAFQDWLKAGLPLPLTEPVDDHIQLHAHLGKLVNEWIYQDHKQSGGNE